MFKKVLVLSPHTDDGEIGCGGSIARFIKEESQDCIDNNGINSGKGTW